MTRTHACAALLAFTLACRDRGAGHAAEVTNGSSASAQRGAGHGGGGAEGATDASAAAAVLVPARLDLGAWLRWGPSDLGCWMERALAHREPRWSCTAPAVPPPDDPCDEAWRAGPEVPDEVARRIHPLLRRVALAWEHGALQGATFQFDPDVPKAAMPRILGIAPGTLDAAAGHGPGRCDTPCYEVVVFAPAQPECEADDEDEGGDE